VIKLTVYDTKIAISVTWAVWSWS